MGHTVNSEDRIVGRGPFTTTGVSFAEGYARREATITEVKTGRSIRLGSATASSWGPAWSPDGTKVAFYSDQSGAPGLWIWDLQTSESYQVPGLVVRPYFGFEVIQRHSDGRRILCKAKRGGI